MNILEAALRRIAIRNTERAITASFVRATNSNSIPRHFKPKIPNFASVIKAIFLFPIYALGAFVIFGLISLLSFKVSLGFSSLFAIMFLLNGILTKRTNGCKSVPLQIADRRYKEGYYQAGYIDVEDTENFIQFSKTQRIYYFLENLFLAIALTAPMYAIHLIYLYENHPK